ncbi:hypothetical protein ACXN5S_02700 [Pseudoroseicyclus sp. H15]
MRRALCLIAALLPGAALAQDDISWLQQVFPAGAEIVADAAEQCDRETDGGELEFQPGSLIEEDLDGDNAGNGPDDLVIDFNYIYCSRAASLWGGTGGAPVHFVLDSGATASWQGWGWEVVRQNSYLPAVILLQRHGTHCDSYGAAPCVMAIVADRGQFYTPVSDQ